MVSREGEGNGGPGHGGEALSYGPAGLLCAKAGGCFPMLLTGQVSNHAQ